MVCELLELPLAWPQYNDVRQRVVISHQSYIVPLESVGMCVAQAGFQICKFNHAFKSKIPCLHEISRSGIWNRVLNNSFGLEIILRIRHVIF